MSKTIDHPVRVLIHPSQFPDAIEASLLLSLETREMNHKFHYDTPKQTQRWLRLHEALSPARTDPDCHHIYEAAFRQCVSSLPETGTVEMVSLGCGGGQKDAQLIRMISQLRPGLRIRYIAADVSHGLALVSRSAAIEAGVQPDDVVPIAIDLAATPDWANALTCGSESSATRIVLFFGMLPNFKTDAVFPRLSSLLRSSDLLVVSANLAPGSDYRSGVERVLPLYDNELTRDWLWSVLLDLGIDREDGTMQFTIEEDGSDPRLLRIESTVRFLRPCHIRYAGRDFDYQLGECFRLFFSYRHTPDLLRKLLERDRLTLTESWINGSDEEGVFLCGRAS